MKALQIIALMGCLLLTEGMHAQRAKNLSTSFHITYAPLRTVFDFTGDQQYETNTYDKGNQTLLCLTQGIGFGLHVNLGLGWRTHSDTYRYYTGFNFETTETLITVEQKDVLLSFRWASPGSLKGFIEAGWLFSEWDGTFEIDTDKTLNSPSGFARNIQKEPKNLENTFNMWRIGAIYIVPKAGISFIAGYTSFKSDTPIFVDNSLQSAKGLFFGGGFTIVYKGVPLKPAAPETQ